MKKALPVLLFVSVCGCGNNSTVKSAAETTTAEKTAATSASETTDPAPQGEGIVGYWKLSLEAYDDNNNKKLDEEEKKKGIKNRYSFRFNADGSCQIMDTFKGRYERKNEKGKDMLYVYRNRIPEEEEKDPPPDIYQVISFTNDELTLLENLGDHVFWVFKRQ